MKITLLAIGDELLNGRTLEKNLYFLGSYLLSQGLELHSCLTFRDHPEELKALIQKLHRENDVLLISGGLGPTLDDLTKGILALSFDKNLVEDAQATKIAQGNYERRNLIWEKNLNSYHFIPEDFIALENPKGLAPGLLYKSPEKKKLLLAGPGVPSEFKAIIEKHLVLKLAEIFPKKETIKASLCIRTKGIPEEKIFNQLCPSLWEDLSKFGKVQSLPGRSGVDIVVGKEIFESDLENFQQKIIAHIESLALRDYVWEYGNKNLEEVIIIGLTKLNLELSLAESCTGGMISSLLTDVPGSSKVFQGGLICYQDKIKIRELQISANLLKDKGAVSAEVATLMSEALLEKFSSDLSLSITGYAGPEVVTQTHPVGTVYIALSSKFDGHLKTETHHFSYKGDREFLKKRFTLTALSLLFDLLKKIEK